MELPKDGKIIKELTVIPPVKGFVLVEVQVEENGTTLSMATTIMASEVMISEVVDMLNAEMMKKRLGMKNHIDQTEE